MSGDQLKKDSLNVFQTIALSVAIMGPSASIAITAGMIGSQVGSSVPLVFLVSLLIVGCVAVSIVKLNQTFPSAGSVYYFVEKTLGRRAGFISGWLIVLAYLVLGVSCIMVSCTYLQILLSIFGVAIHWLFIGLFLMGLIFALAHKDAETSTWVMLLIEIVSMGLILLVAGIILVNSQKTAGLSMVPFTLGDNNLSSLGYASVFGFLAFAGFEGASALGDESKNPKATIPLAITSGIIITGIFYVLVSYVQVIGFGLTTEGMAAFTGSNSPLSDLIAKYLGTEFSIVMLLCMSVSFFTSTLGCVNAGARVLFTMSRDGMLSPALGRIHAKNNTPYVGLNVFVAAITMMIVVSFSLEAIKLAGYAAITGTLALLLAYIFTSIGAMVYFYKNRSWRGVRLIMPAGAIIALALIIFVNIYPVPVFPQNLFTYGVIIWLGIGIILSRNQADAIVSAPTTSENESNLS
ncbi:MAG: APC family permease [Acetobacterium woodii]|nr:APC family permease [Acetobacterium woodii]